MAEPTVPTPPPVPPTVASASLFVGVRLQVTGPTLEDIDKFKLRLERLLLQEARADRAAQLAAKHHVVIHLVTSDR